MVSSMHLIRRGTHTNLQPGNHFEHSENPSDNFSYETMSRMIRARDAQWVEDRIARAVAEERERTRREIEDVKNLLRRKA